MCVDILSLLKDFWLQYCIECTPGIYKHMYGACTFDQLTIDFVENKKQYGIFFHNYCYRPMDGIIYHPFKHSIFTQFQVLMRRQKNVMQHVKDSINYILRDNVCVSIARDNWRAPTMSSYGLGYEVCLYSCEVVQVTNFSVFCGVNIQDEEIVEITYGVDRLSMFLNNKDSLKIQEYDPLLNDMNNIYNSDSQKLWDELQEIFLIQDYDFTYELFLKLNFLFNILDSKAYFTKNIKNLLMFKINKKFYEWHKSK